MNIKRTNFTDDKLGQLIEGLKRIITVLEDTQGTSGEFTSNCIKHNVDYMSLRALLSSKSFSNCLKQSENLIDKEYLDRYAYNPYVELYANVFGIGKEATYRLDLPLTILGQFSMSVIHF